MNTVSRTISGGVAFVLGLFIIVVTLSDEPDLLATVFGLAWGVFIGGVGIYIFFNKKEDDIEKINDDNK